MIWDLLFRSFLELKNEEGGPERRNEEGKYQGQEWGGTGRETEELQTYKVGLSDKIEDIPVKLEFQLNPCVSISQVVCGTYTRHTSFVFLIYNSNLTESLVFLFAKSGKPCYKINLSHVPFVPELVITFEGRIAGGPKGLQILSDGHDPGINTALSSCS